MKINDNKYYYTYEDIHNFIRNNYQQISNNIDCIVAIGTGGFIPARILKTYLNIPIYTITVQSYNNNNETNMKLFQWLDMDLSNKKIVIVDEVDDTRNTLQFCVSQLKEINKLINYEIFVIHNKIKEKKWDIPKEIKYHCCETIQNKWIVYPWDNK